MRDAEDNLEFAVLTDRAEGGASLEDGVVELMVGEELKFSKQEDNEDIEFSSAAKKHHHGRPAWRQ